MNALKKAPGLIAATTAVALLGGAGQATAAEQVNWSLVPADLQVPLAETLADCDGMNTTLAVGQVLVEAGVEPHQVSAEESEAVNRAESIESMAEINCENLAQITQWQHDGRVAPNSDPSALTVAAYMGGARSVLNAGGTPTLCDVSICQDAYVELVRTTGEKYVR